MNKKIVNLMVGFFKNKKTGEVVSETMGEEYDDGSFSHNVYDARYWEFIREEKIPAKRDVPHAKSESKLNGGEK